MNELQVLYDDGIRGLLGFPSADVSVGFECLFRPTFHDEGAMFVSMGDGGPGELIVRAATRSIFGYVGSVARAEAGALATIEPPPIATERAPLDERSCSSLRELVAAAIREPEVEGGGGGRDGMAVDVILRDGTTTLRRRLLTTDGGAKALAALLRSAVDLAIRLMERSSVEGHLRTIRSYLADVAM